jgi:hypothetical protein
MGHEFRKLLQNTGQKVTIFLSLDLAESLVGHSKCSKDEKISLVADYL